MSIQTAQEVYRCREVAAEMFGLENPAAVVFTPNCTASLNTVIHSLLRNGGRAVVSDMEHNSVMRPLYALSPAQPIFDVAKVVIGDDEETVENFRRCITRDTRLILCTQASNVIGYRLPIRRIGELAAAYGIPFVVDGAQGGGAVPLDMKQDHIDYLCLPGHKGLYGPMGTGLLLCAGQKKLYPLTEGGTGSNSLSPEQPEELPDRLESGTVNVPGICGLRAGMEWVNRCTMRRIHTVKTRLMAQLYDGLRRIPQAVLYAPPPTEQNSSGVLSFNLREIPCEKTAEALAKRGIAVRAGLHCAPSAHRKIGTLPNGTVRISPSFFNTPAEISHTLKIIRDLSGKPLQYF